VPRGVVRLTPAVPAQYLPLTVDNVMLGEQRVTIHVTQHRTELRGLGSGLKVLTPQLRS
jgi:hypothetical protein